MGKGIFVTIAFLFSFVELRSQDPYFSNTNQSLVFLDPSFAGTNGLFRWQMSYRNQWPEIYSNAVTGNGAIEGYFRKLHAGIAVVGNVDAQARGTLLWRSLGLVYAQHFYSKDQKFKIIPSVQASYIWGLLDKSKLIFGDQIDPRRGFYWSSSEIVPSSRKRNIDISSGILVNYTRFYFGFSASHINQPDIGFLGVSKLPCRFSFHSSYNLFIGEKNIIHFFVQYNKQANFQSLSFKINTLLFKHVIVGSAISSGDQVSFFTGYRHNVFVVSFSYDRWYNAVPPNRINAWEVHLSLNFRGKEKNKELGNFETW